jgi:hypothetical protein
MAITLVITSGYTSSYSQAIDPVLSVRRSLPANWLGWDLATTTRGGVSCTNSWLQQKLPLLHTKTLRFPGGDFANWYDWKTGWYKDTVLLPVKYLSLPKVPNKLEDFKTLLDLTGADAILDLNMLTASLQDQIAMLKHAVDIGINLKYVELGEEFYLDGETQDTTLILELYPTVEDYGKVAKVWIDTIHHYFPNVKVAVQANFDKNSAPRRVVWNDGILATVDNDDAWSFHYYYNSNFYDPEETTAEKLDVNMSEIPIMLYQPFAAWEILYKESLPRVPQGSEAWVTEYNLADHERPTHGTWFQGIFQAMQTMLLLHDDRVKIATPHAVDGSAVYGAFFYSDDGFSFGADGAFIPPANPPASTEFWGKTATGYSMSLLGETLDGMKYASPLSFNGDLQLSAYDRNKDETHYYDALYGWLFNNTTESRAIIVNLSGVSQKITNVNLFPLGGTYQILSAPVLGLIAGPSDITITSGNLPLKLTIPPYSIVKISGNTIPTPPPPKAVITANASLNLCEGDSVQLNAGSGYDHFVWSTGATTQKIWVKTQGEYWVKAYPLPFGYCGADTVQIVVNELPKAPNIVPLGNKKFCHGGSVAFELGAGYTETDVDYFWPLTGATTPYTTATESGGYYVTVMNDKGCTANSDTEEVTVYPLPVPVISSIGPSSACYDVDVTLQAPLGYNAYNWSDGTHGQTQIFSVSGSYYCTVADANNCDGKSNTIAVTIWEPPLPGVTLVGTNTWCEGVTSNWLTTLPGYTYQWIKGSVNVSGATAQNYVPTANGAYKVQIGDSHNCKKKSTASVTVTVNKTPVVSITITGTTNICNGETRKLTCTATGGSGMKYVWKKNGVIISGATAKTYTATASGNYKCEATNSVNCMAVSNVINITSNCKEGADKASEVVLQVYPNPAHDLLHMSLETGDVESGYCTIEVRNLLGETISFINEEFSGSEITSDIPLESNLPNGIYLLLVRYNELLYHKQFVIAKP